MEDITNKLAKIAAKVIKINDDMRSIETEWQKVASKCKYGRVDFFESGSGALECGNIDRRHDDDPFCYAANCPLIK